MTVFYKPFKSSIKSKDGKNKWYPRLVKVGTPVTTRKIADKVALLSSLSPGDVHNVIQNLTVAISEMLMSSRTVNLEGLGSFTLIARAGGKGVDTVDEVNHRQIKGLRIQFTPSGIQSSNGAVTRSMYTGVEYELYGKHLKASGTNTGGTSEEEDDEPIIDPNA